MGNTGGSRRLADVRPGGGRADADAESAHAGSRLNCGGGYSPIYPCHVTPRDMRSHPIGTGPFKLVEFKPNERITVTRNPDYWKARRPLAMRAALPISILLAVCVALSVSASAKQPRSASVKHEFQMMHPAHQPGARGGCPGYVKDHVVPRRGALGGLRARLR